MRDEEDLRRCVPTIAPGAITGLLQELARAPMEVNRVLDGFHPGQVVGRFEIVREIGRGGFGVVYEAKDVELGRTVALKAVLPTAAPNVREDRLLREAEAAARLSHPNIVTVHDVGRCDAGPYLVLERARRDAVPDPTAQGEPDRAGVL